MNKLCNKHKQEKNCPECNRKPDPNIKAPNYVLVTEGYSPNNLLTKKQKSYLRKAIKFLKDRGLI